MGYVFQDSTREAELVGDICIKGFILRNWFLNLWGLESIEGAPEKGDYQQAGTHGLRLELPLVGGLSFLSGGNLASVFKAFQLIQAHANYPRESLMFKVY